LLRGVLRFPLVTSSHFFIFFFLNRLLNSATLFRFALLLQISFPILPFPKNAPEIFLPPLRFSSFPLYSAYIAGGRRRVPCAYSRSYLSSSIFQKGPPLYCRIYDRFFFVFQNFSFLGVSILPEPRLYSKIPFGASIFSFFVFLSLIPLLCLTVLV